MIEESTLEILEIILWSLGNKRAKETCLENSEETQLFYHQAKMYWAQASYTLSLEGRIPILCMEYGWVMSTPAVSSITSEWPVAV